MSDPLSMVVGLYPAAFRNPEALERSDLPTGWVTLVVQLLGDLKVMTMEAGDEQGIVMRQVKEKFGGLRFYWSLKGQSDIRLDVMGMPGGSFTVLPEGDTSPLFEAIRARVRQAEQHSLTICQDCSDGAMLDEFSQGYAVLCMSCRGERQAWGERVKSEPQPSGTYRVYPSPVRVVEAVVTPLHRGPDHVVVEDARRLRYALSRDVRLIDIDQLRTVDRVVCTVMASTGDDVISAALVR